jgi:hypothetical protein
MTLHFQSLLSTMDQPELAQLWEGAGIEKVEVINSQKIWRIFVAIPQPITAFDINRTLQRLTSEYPFLNRIEIIPRLNEPERHINWLVQKRKDDVSSFLLSKGIELWRSDTVEYKIQDHRLDLYCSHQGPMKKFWSRVFVLTFPTGSGRNTTCSCWSEYYARKKRLRRRMTTTGLFAGMRRL